MSGNIFNNQFNIIQAKVEGEEKSKNETSLGEEYYSISYILYSFFVAVIHLIIIIGIPYLFFVVISQNLSFIIFFIMILILLYYLVNIPSLFTTMFGGIIGFTVEMRFLLSTNKNKSILNVEEEEM